MSYSGSRDTPGSNLRCSCSASERVSTIVWNAAATLCEGFSDDLGIGFLARAFLTTDLDFFGAILRRVFAIVPFLLEVFAFFIAFEAILLLVFLAIIDPPPAGTRFVLRSIRGAWAIAPGVMSANEMVQPCSCLASDESGKGLQRQRSTPCLQYQKVRH